VTVLRDCGYEDVDASDVNDWGFRPCRIENFLASQVHADSIVTKRRSHDSPSFEAMTSMRLRDLLPPLVPEEYERLKATIKHRDFP
jgi:hypothetical protein